MKLEMAKPEMAKLVRKLGMLVPGSCCDKARDKEAADNKDNKAADGEVGDGEAGREAKDALCQALAVVKLEMAAFSSP